MLAQIATRERPEDPEQIVCTLMDEGYYGPYLRKAGTDVHSLNLRPGEVSPAAIKAIIFLLRRYRPDVFVTWLYHADLAGTLAAPLGGLARRRLVWNLRCSQMEFEHYSRATRFIVRTLAALSGVPRAIIGNSHAGIEAHRALGYAPSNWIHVPNGFDLNCWYPDDRDRERVRAELGVTADEVAIGIIARVDPQKDHRTFFEAAVQVIAPGRAVRFVVIGRGTADLNVPQELRPFTSVLGERADVPRLLRALDIVVMSSAFGEGFPNVLGEAMATGIPCVATDVGDAAEIIGPFGRIVPARAPALLASALVDLISLGLPGRSVIGQAARARMIAKYDLRHVRSEYLQLFAAIARDLPLDGFPSVDHSLR